MTLPYAFFLRVLCVAMVLSLAGLLRADEAQDLYDRGETLLSATNVPAARAIFEQVIAQYPHAENALAAHYRLGQMLLATNPMAAAEHFAIVAGSAERPLAEPAAFNRGEAQYQAADWKGAVDAYSAVLTRFADGKFAAQALYSRGWSLFQSGEFERALADFQAFREKYPSHALAPECLLKAGDCLRQLRNFDEAMRAYEQVRGAYGRLAPAALAGKAWVLLAQRDFAAAQAAFCDAAKAYGWDPQAAVLIFNAGTAALETRQYAVAGDLFGQVQQGWPTHELARPAMYWQAVALFRQNKMDAAAAKLEMLRQVGAPRELAAETAVLYAQTQEARGRFSEAAALYAAVGTNFPGHALAETSAASYVMALEKAGNLATAETAAVAFAQKYPASAQRPAIQFLIGEYRYRQANYAGAAPELERFARDYPTNELAVAALHKAAWCYWYMKQTGRAGELFNVIARDYPKSPLAADAAVMKGRVAELAGDPAAAADAYAEAVRLGKDGEAAQRAAIELMRLDHAGRHYNAELLKADAFIASHANSEVLPRARLYRAEALLELGRLPEALQAYKLVGDADPVAAAGAAYGMAWVWRRQGQHAEAAKAFSKVAAGPSTYAGDAMFWAARSQEDAGNFDAASTAYGACLLQTPPGAHVDEAAYRQAYCLWQTRKPEDAERLYNTMIHEHSSSPFAANALYDLAWVMLERGRKAEARQRFEAFVRQYPKHLLAPDAHFRLGELARENDEFAVAATHYEIAAAAQVAFRDKALYKLAWMREKLGQHDAAVQTFLRLAKQFPQSEFVAEAQYHAGCLLQVMNKFDEARAAMAAVEDGVFAEKAACGVADCWRNAGRHAEAIAAYSQVLAKWPHGDCRVPALLGRAGERRATGAFAEAIADYAEVARGGETIESAQALLGQGHCLFALNKWEDAARCFLKVDVLYGFDELKPEALAMAAKCWEQAGDVAKAAAYREDLKKRFPKSREAQ